MPQHPRRGQAGRGAGEHVRASESGAGGARRLRRPEQLLPPQSQRQRCLQWQARSARLQRQKRLTPLRWQLHSCWLQCRQRCQSCRSLKKTCMRRRGTVGRDVRVRRLCGYITQAPLTWQPEPQYAAPVPQKPKEEQQSPGLQLNWSFGAPQEPSVVTGRIAGRVAVLVAEDDDVEVRVAVAVAVEHRP